MLPLMRLEGKVALVTGGTRGIGAAIVDALASAGATVVYTGRNPALAPSGRGFRHALACDLADQKSVERVFGFVGEELGGVDVLVNNAAIHDDAAAHNMTEQQFKKVVDVNLFGTFLCSKLAVLQMRAHGRGGAIVNVSSIGAVTANVGQINYVASKAGVDAMTKVMARENARRGIRVNAIRPGLTETEMTKGMPAAVRTEKLTTIPLGRPGMPSEVAQAVLFLASPAASYITGVVLDVTGGRGL